MPTDAKISIFILFKYLFVLKSNTYHVCCKIGFFFTTSQRRAVVEQEQRYTHRNRYLNEFFEG